MATTRELGWRIFILIWLTSSALGASRAHHNIQGSKAVPKLQASSTPNASPTPTPVPCDPVQRASSCELVVDADHKAAQSVIVHNNAEVILRILHQPFATCSISGENRAPEKPEAPLGSLLAALTPIAPIFPGGAFFAADLKNANSLIGNANAMLKVRPKPRPGPVPTPTDPVANEISRELTLAETTAKDLGGHLEDIRLRYSKVNDTLNSDLSGPFPPEDDLHNKITHSDTAITSELNNDENFASLDRLSGELTALNRQIRAYEETHPNADPSVIDEMNQRIDKLNGIKEKYAEAEKLLQAARDDLRGIHEYLNGGKTFALSQTISLVPDKNSTTTGSLTCVDDQTKNSWGQDVPLSVTYDELPAWSFNVGVLFSSLGRLQYGIKPQATSPPPSSGPQTGSSKIVETDKSKVQIIPFSFVNYRLTDWVWADRQWQFALSGGLGANPNNGDTEAEFFEGGSFSIGNVSLYFGFHNGRRQRIGGGFTLNQTVDPQTVPSLPLNHVWWNQPAIGISYRIPLGS